MVLMLPPVRSASESSMSAHMLVQYNGMLLAGALLGSVLLERSLPDGALLEPSLLDGTRFRRLIVALQQCNELGIAGLFASAITLTILMVPIVLDLALADWRIELLKLLSLVAIGAAMRLSWQRAGTVVQAFFLGNLLPMMAVVGTLYQDSTTRLCNAYLLDDQHFLGVALIWIAIVVAAVWLLNLGRPKPSVRL